MKPYTCPFCQITFPLSVQTFNTVDLSFDDLPTAGGYKKINPDVSDMVEYQVFRCPSCKKVSIEVEGKGDKVSNLHLRLHPFSLNAIDFPDYIPGVILKDYREACAILQLSPKASATLSRRCLQGMIRDFFKDVDKIPGSSLYNEIIAIENHVAPIEVQVLKDLKDIGNIGAHPEKDINTIVDIEPLESEKLIKVIEYFLDSWYINRHRTEELFSDIHEIKSDLFNRKI